MFLSGRKAGGGKIGELLKYYIRILSTAMPIVLWAGLEQSFALFVCEHNRLVTTHQGKIVILATQFADLIFIFLLQTTFVY